MGQTCHKNTEQLKKTISKHNKITSPSILQTDTDSNINSLCSKNINKKEQKRLTNLSQGIFIKITYSKYKKSKTKDFNINLKTPLTYKIKDIKSFFYETNNSFCMFNDLINGLFYESDYSSILNGNFISYKISEDSGYYYYIETMLNISMSDWEVDVLLQYISKFSSLKNVKVPIKEDSNISTIYQSTQLNTNDSTNTRRGSKNIGNKMSNKEISKNNKNAERSASVVNNIKNRKSDLNRFDLNKNLSKSPNTLRSSSIKEVHINNLTSIDKKKNRNVLFENDKNKNEKNHYNNILKQIKIWKVYINGQIIDLSFCVDQNRIILNNDTIEFRYEKLID